MLKRPVCSSRIRNWPFDMVLCGSAKIGHMRCGRLSSGEAAVVGGNDFLDLLFRQKERSPEKTTLFFLEPDELASILTVSLQ